MTLLRDTQGLLEIKLARRNSYWHLRQKKSPIVTKKKEPYLYTNIRHRGLDTGLSSNIVNYRRKGTQPKIRNMNKHFFGSFHDNEKKNIGSTSKLKNYLHMSRKI